LSCIFFVFHYDLFFVLLLNHKKYQKGETGVLSLQIPKFLEAQQSSQTSVLTPMPCKVTKVFVKPGQRVEKDQSLMTLEAMKMEVDFLFYFLFHLMFFFFIFFFHFICLIDIIYLFILFVPFLFCFFSFFFFFFCSFPSSISFELTENPSSHFIFSMLLKPLSMVSLTKSITLKEHL